MNEIKKLYDKFIEMEQNEKMFELEYKGIRYWDAIRHKVFMSIYNSKYNLKPNILPNLRKREKLFLIINQLLYLFKILFINYDTIALCSSRMIKNNQKHDPILHPFISSKEGNVLKLELFLFNKNKDNSSYYQIFLKTYKKVFKSKYNKSINEEIVNIEQIVKKYFKNMYITQEKVIEEIAKYIIEIKYYEILLAIIKPKKIFLVQDGVQKAIIFQANNMEIPIIELQHGDANLWHPLYHYSDKIDYKKINTLPNVFLTFSEYWGKHYPVKKYIIGKSTEIRSSVNSKSICIIFSNGHEDILMRYTKLLSEEFKDYKIYLKLHPYQMKKYKSIKEEIKRLLNVEIVNIHEEFNKTLSYVQNIIMIKSTCLFEALQQNKRVFILEYLDYKVFEYAFNEENLFLVKNIDDIKLGLEKAINIKELPYYDSYNIDIKRLI